MEIKIECSGFEDLEDEYGLEEDQLSDDMFD
jgi:hypothetical protein